MKILTWPRQRWQYLLEVEIIIIALSYLLAGMPHDPKQFIIAGIMLILLVLNRYQRQTKYLKYLNILLISRQLCAVWVKGGNYLLEHLASLSVLVIVVLWLIWLVILLPLVMTSVSEVHNWLLRLIVFNIFLDVQYGTDVKLKIKNLPLMHTFNGQGVISAVALLILVCFMIYSWGYRFKPDLKFMRGKYFKWSVFIALLLLLVICVWWDAFGFSIDLQAKYFTWPNFTAALEPGILEEVERYANVMILLIAFKNNRKWRIPIAVYGSSLVFCLMHLDNIGYHGQSVMASVGQAIGVSDAMIFVVVYFYIGKLWLPMLAHFSMDYFINLQSGWASSASWTGDVYDWVDALLPLIFGLAVTIWMMYGQRRQVMEENVDRLLLNSK